jgi:murein DD-endopeptidase MepM/ murein hydrolase activator NlpD
MIKIIFLFLFVPFLSLAAVEDPFLEAETQLLSLQEDQIKLSIEKTEIENQIKHLKDKIQSRKILLLKRLKAQVRLKNYRWGELFLKQDLNELNRNLKIIKNLNAFDLELHKEYNSNLRLLALSQKNLADTEKLIAFNIEQYQKQIEQLKQLEQIRLTQLMKEKVDSLLVFKGQLARPLEGKPVDEFGTLKDKSNLYFLINKGERYKTNAGNAVKSVGLGVVIFSDALAGWRETLIVQHSDNYYSVYAGIKATTKKVGDTVAKGEKLALTAGSEFYFELRHYANPINPKAWYEEQL